MNRFGPTLEEKGVRFRLWAPSVEKVLLEIEGQSPLAMDTRPGGWKEVFAEAAIGTRYRFRIGGQPVPDPASRAQAGGVHGWSVVTAPLRADPNWKGKPWEEAVLYECHPGLLGGFKGVAEKLPALQTLGVTAIELMPIAAFPGARNWGYDGVLPFAPAEAYGTPEDLQALIARAHALGLMILLDVVYNHFGPEGNYLALYAKPFFRADAPTPWGSAIDFRVLEVRDFFSENARHWLFGYGFDGLRFDAVHAIKDEGWLDRLAQELRREANSRHIHLTLENDDNAASYLRQGFDAQWNDDVHHAFHVLLTGEGNGYYSDYSQRPAEMLARGLAEGFIYQGERSPYRHGSPRGEPSHDLPPSAFIDFLQNHDQTGNRPFGERLIRLSDPRALKAAIACLLLSPHIPMIFMGEELGSRSPFYYFTDHEPELAKQVREGRRREFQAAAGAAHDDLSDCNSEETFQSSDPAFDAPEKESWLAYYSALLGTRRRHVMPRLKGSRAGGAQAVGEKAVLAHWRMGDGERLTIAVNLGETAISANLPKDGLIWGERRGVELQPFTTLAWLSHV